MPKEVAIKAFKIGKKVANGKYAEEEISGLTMILEYDFNEWREKIAADVKFAQNVYKIMARRQASGMKVTAVKDFVDEREGKVKGVRGKKPAVNDADLF